MDVLEKFDVLSELTPDEREALHEFLDPMQYADGQLLFQRGQESDELLLICDGRVRLEASQELEGVLGAGEVLGGAGLVLIGKRMAAATAEGDVEVLSLSRERYLRIRSEHPVIALKLLEGILSGFSNATRRLVES